LSSEFKNKLSEIITINKINLIDADKFFLSSINPKKNKKTIDTINKKSFIIEEKPKILDENLM
jgi:hypothetical protein